MSPLGDWLRGFNFKCETEIKNLEHVENDYHPYSTRGFLSISMNVLNKSAILIHWTY